MNEDRIKAYLYLITNLLRCPRGEIPAILNGNKGLVDDDFIEIISQMSGTCALVGERDMAYCLLDLAFEIAATMGKSSMQQQIEADRLLQRGVQQSEGGRFQDAIPLWEQALTIYQKIGNRKGEANALANLGNACNLMGEYQQAIHYYQQSQAIEEEIGNYERKAASLNNLGNAFYSLGEYQKAINYYQQSLSISREFGDSREEAAALSNFGNALHCIGQYKEAIRYHQHSLVIKRNRGDSRGEAVCLDNLGNAFYALGEYQKAIEHYQRGLQISREVGNPLGEAASLNNLGMTFYRLGQHKKAIEHYHRSLLIAREIGSPTGEAASLNNLGNCFYYLKEYSQSINFYDKSLVVSRKIGNLQGEATSLAELGTAFYALGQYQESIEYHKQSLIIKQKIGDCYGEAISLGNIGINYYCLEQYQKAIEYYNQSVTIARQIGNRYVEGISLNNIGAVLLKSGQLAEAEIQLDEAIKILESLRIGLEDAHKISIFEEQARTYQRLQEVLVVQGKTKDALEIAERGRARAFVELIAQRSSFKSPEQVHIAIPNLQQIQKIAQEQNSTIVEYSIIYDDFDWLGKKQTQESLLFIWVISPCGKIAFRQVDLKPVWQQQNSSLAEIIILLRQLIGVKENFGNTTSKTKIAIPQAIGEISQALQLHQILIEPITELLPTDRNIPVVFIPQTYLSLVPFPVLQDKNGKLLIEKHTILTAPSIQVLDLTLQAKQKIVETSIDALVVGNPKMPCIALNIAEPPQQLATLPASGAEANMIASFFNTQPILGEKATKVNIVQQMPKARLIHLATHGLLDDIKQLGVPGAIALAPSAKDNGFLTASEIMEMFGQPQGNCLQAELVVLSACVTGLGKITGDGVIGLSRCLMTAGVPRVIVSLWAVSDLSTAFLMIKFHELLKHFVPIKPGDAAKTLNQAQKWLAGLNSEEAKQELEKLKPHIYQALADRKPRVAEVRINSYLKEICVRAPYPFANPIYWAGFTTIGL